LGLSGVTLERLSGDIAGYLVQDCARCGLDLSDERVDSWVSAVVLGVLTKRGSAFAAKTEKADLFCFAGDLLEHLSVPSEAAVVGLSRVVAGYLDQDCER